ncbi:MAG: DUF2752 domain-containing protein [Acidimicrobiales bacterium]|nr:DUF2752 domain-containing protein [Acidimicrobiales bacterium]
MNVGPRSTLELRDLRIAGGLLLAGAALIPLLPGPDGLPCPLRSLTGIPCPLCGLTTSVTAAVHLDPFAAVAANPAGLLAVLVAIGLLVFRGRRQVSVPLWPAPVALVAMELWQLARFGVL